jgi:hypothetical protein
VKHINDLIKYYAQLTIPVAKDRIWRKIGIIMQRANAYAIQMRTLMAIKKIRKS